MASNEYQAESSEARRLHDVDAERSKRRALQASTATEGSTLPLSCSPIPWLEGPRRAVEPAGVPITIRAGLMAQEGPSEKGGLEGKLAGSG